VTLWFRLAAQGWAFLGYLLLAALPDVVTQGFGHPRLPAAVHAMTLGVLLTGYYGLQGELLTRAYGRPPPWPWLSWAVWGTHFAGVAAMVGGFLGAGFLSATIGAHYLVPVGVLLHGAQAVAAVWKRARETPRHTLLHLPLAGLVATMALGAMIILDAATARYGLYTPPMLMIHGLTGALLFVLPAQRIHGLRDLPLLGNSSRPWAWAAWSATATALAAVATGRPWPLASGLAGLGAVCLWFGWPTARAPDAGLRAPWCVPGLFFLYASGRCLAGLPPDEIPGLAKLGGTAVLLVAALPGMTALLRRQTHGRETPLLARRLFLALAIAGMVIAMAGTLDSAAWVRAGASAGAAAVLLQGWPSRLRL
jgi:hypothetical protein